MRSGLGFIIAACRLLFQMKKIRSLSSWLKLLSLMLAIAVSSCGGGSSADPPTGFVATAGGGQVTLTWNATPGVSYWLLYSATSSAIDMKNPPASHTWVTPVTSPYVVTGLTNGTTYAFAIDGRVGGGAGGTQTATIFAVPRPAGSGTWSGGVASWIAATGTTPPSTLDVTSVMYGVNSSSVYDYMAVTSSNNGGTGTIYYSTDGQTWTQDGAAIAQNYTASMYFSYASRFLAASSGGNYLYYSTAPGSWTAANGISSAIYGMAASSSIAVAVGAGGAVYHSADGIAWTAGSISGTAPSTIYGVTYSSTYGFVAVGTGGHYLTSSDGISWTVGSTTAGTSADLRGITNYSGTFVAVGATGMVVKSTGGAAAWSASTVGTHNFNAVTTDGVQYVALGSSGTIFTSPDATTWTDQSSNSGTAHDLLGIYGNEAFYVAVGASGTIVTAK